MNSVVRTNLRDELEVKLPLFSAGRNLRARNGQGHDRKRRSNRHGRFLKGTSILEFRAISASRMRPRGRLRLDAAAAAPDGSVFQATQFGNFCTQPSGDAASERDCLTLNVFTP